MAVGTKRSKVLASTRAGLSELTAYADFVYDDCGNCNSSDLVHARTHAELAGRKARPIHEGCSFREKLMTDDYWNWE